MYIHIFYPVIHCNAVDTTSYSTSVFTFASSFFPNDRSSDDNRGAKIGWTRETECERLLRSAVISGMFAVPLAKSHRDVATPGPSVSYVRRAVSSVSVRLLAPHLFVPSEKAKPLPEITLSYIAFLDI